MLTIDGSYGEGGGQVLRSSLALSLITGAPFHLKNVRAGRAKPGLLRQHLACVRAAAAFGAAEVSGDTLGSGEVRFAPKSLIGGEHAIAIGSAGSAMLVVQAVLPALLYASGPSRLVVEGGTHNPSAPPFPFIEQVFVPLLRRMGATLSLTLHRPGFFPAGGGRVTLEVTPSVLRPITLDERPASLSWSATALLAGVPHHVGERELAYLGDALAIAPDALHIARVDRPAGPGNALWATARWPHGAAMFTGFGKRGVSSERVAASVAADAAAWVATQAPVDAHLADQLLLPMALGGGGRFVTSAPSAHTTTNAWVIARFLDVDIAFTPLEFGQTRVDVAAR